MENNLFFSTYDILKKFPTKGSRMGTIIKLVTPLNKIRTLIWHPSDLSDSGLVDYIPQVELTSSLTETLGGKAADSLAIQALNKIKLNNKYPESDFDRIFIINSNGEVELKSKYSQLSSAEINEVNPELLTLTFLGGESCSIPIQRLLDLGALRTIYKSTSKLYTLTSATLGGHKIDLDLSDWFKNVIRFNPQGSPTKLFSERGTLVDLVTGRDNHLYVRSNSTFEGVVGDYSQPFKSLQVAIDRCSRESNNYVINILDSETYEISHIDTQFLSIQSEYSPTIRLTKNSVFNSYSKYNNFYKRLEFLMPTGNLVITNNYSGDFLKVSFLKLRLRLNSLTFNSKPHSGFPINLVKCPGLELNVNNLRLNNSNGFNIDSDLSGSDVVDNIIFDSKVNITEAVFSNTSTKRCVMFTYNGEDNLDIYVNCLKSQQAEDNSNTSHNVLISSKSDRMSNVVIGAYTKGVALGEGCTNINYIFRNTIIHDMSLINSSECSLSGTIREWRLISQNLSLFSNNSNIVFSGIIQKIIDSSQSHIDRGVLPFDDSIVFKEFSVLESNCSILHNYSTSNDSNTHTLSCIGSVNVYLNSGLKLITNASRNSCIIDIKGNLTISKTTNLNDLTLVKSSKQITGVDSAPSKLCFSRDNDNPQNYISDLNLLDNYTFQGELTGFPRATVRFTNSGDYLLNNTYTLELSYESDQDIPLNFQSTGSSSNNDNRVVFPTKNLILPRSSELGKVSFSTVYITFREIKGRILGITNMLNLEF